MQPLRLALLASLFISVLATGALSATTPEILAFVGEDTLTTVDLRIELNLMEKRGGAEEQKAMPEAGQVIRRLVQNRLLIQEGYRMGLDGQFTVKNQVTEAVNSRCMGALLDSVALAVPSDSEDLYDARLSAVNNYIENLMVVHDVKVDSTLLRSLDYGSKDPQMQTMLHNSEDILAEVPTGKLSVSAFSRIVRFTAFHGLEGKPNADQRRDEIFHEWVAEAVTIHEARNNAIRNRPIIQLYKTRLERALMLEETLKILLQIKFEPTEKDIDSFYQENTDQFLQITKVKMESLKFATEEAANAARKRLEQGAKMSWIKRNMDQVIDGPSPFPMELFEAGKLGLDPEKCSVGFIPEPFGVPGGWVLAQVSHVQEPLPIPLNECLEDVLTQMKGAATAAQLNEILSRLEEAVEVHLQPNAETIVGRILAELEEKE